LLKYTSPCSQVARVIGAEVLVVALLFFEQAFASLRLAAIFRTEVLVVAHDTDENASVVRIARIVGALVVVVAVFGSMETFSFCTQFFIGADVPIIFAWNRFMQALTGFHVATINGEGVPIIAVFLCKDTISFTDLITPVFGAEVSVVALFFLVQAVTGFLVTGVSGALVFVFAYDLDIDASTFSRKAGVVRTEILVVACAVVSFVYAHAIDTRIVGAFEIVLALVVVSAVNDFHADAVLAF